MLWRGNAAAKEERVPMSGGKDEASAAPFRWRNCHADIGCWRHGQTLELFLADVILPALASLEAKIASFAGSDDAGDIFFQSDIEDVLIETKLAFGLSIQSIWERQFRAYVKGAARDLRPDLDLERKLEKADWKALTSHFRDLRGIRLQHFPSFETLDTLQHLGNACRHGDGDSARVLAERCPDLWKTYPPLPEIFGETEPVPRTVAMIDLPVARLVEFVAAIARFWNDAGYIYNESIDCKHDSLQRQLEKDRSERDWLPAMALAEPREAG